MTNGPTNPTFLTGNPEHFPHHEDVDILALRDQNDGVGVPTSVGDTFIGIVTVWGRRLEDEGLSSDLMTEINAGLTMQEMVYPGSTLWDASRQVLAGRLFNGSYLQAAVELVSTMHSSHFMARAATELGARDECRHAAIIMRGLLERLQTAPDNRRFLGFTQAVIDRTIMENPFSTVIDVYEGIIRQEKPDYNEVEDWADSQSKVMPDADWKAVSAFVRDDEKWAGIPVRYRRHTVMRHFMMLNSLRTEISTELVAQIVETLEGVQEIFPDAPVWDELRVLFTTDSLERGYPLFALDFARSIKDAEQQQLAVDMFVINRAEDEALELASTITDPTLMAKSLLDADWSDDKGTLRLEEILLDDSSYSIERRIACWTVIRDRYMKRELLVEARECDDNINKLQQLLREQKTGE